MPSGEVHKQFYKMLGLNDEEAKLLQSHIDGPARWAGPGHRKFNHSINDALFFSIAHGDKYLMPYISHLVADGIKDKKTKAMLECLALLQQ